MNERIFVELPESYEIDFNSATLSRRKDWRQNSLEFELPADSPLRSNSIIRYESYGGTVFRGVAYPQKGGRGTVKWRADDIISVSEYAFTPRIRYGSMPVSDSYIGLPIRYVFSSDPPIQPGDTLADESEAEATDPMTYLAGLVWAMQSALPPGLHNMAADAETGIITLPGFGLSGPAAGRDVYFAGHLCAEVGDEDDLDDADYQVYRSPTALKIIGTGEGDIHDPIYIDRIFDSKLEMGSLDKADDFMFAALDVAYTPYWPLLSDFLASHGMYLRVRHERDATYLDGLVVPVHRGSSNYPIDTIREEECTRFDYVESINPPVSVMIASGRAGDWPEGERYARADLSRRGAWFSHHESFGESSLPPFGVLDRLGDTLWGDLIADGSVRLKKADFAYSPGDWLKIITRFHEELVMQVQSTEDDAGDPETRAILGGPDASVENAMIQRVMPESISDMMTGAKQGSESAEKDLGNATTLTHQWTPVAWTVRDTARVYYSLSAVDPEETNFPDLRITLAVTVNGTVAAILRDRIWGGELIHRLEITDLCKLDGTQETLTVTVSDPMGKLNETISYNSEIQGVGRYSFTPIASLRPDGTVSNSFSLVGAATAHEALADPSEARYVGVAGGSASATCDLSTETLPDIAVKVRIVAKCGLFLGFNPFGVSVVYKARPFIVSGGATYYGNYANLSQDWKDISAEWETKPGGGAWDQAAIDALRGGVEIVAVSGADKGGGRCCELRVDLL